MSIITLTTDYGYKDHYVGSLKGKILSDYPEATIVDISHAVDPFNIIETSYILQASYRNFPKGTIHIIGVDIELTSENQHHIVMLWDNQYFICADNGILSILSQKIVPEKIFSITIHDRLPEDATDLDVFKTVAIHLAKGGTLNVIGKEITALKEVKELKPIISDKQIKGTVIYVNNYGNVVTNITKKIFQENSKNRKFQIRLRYNSISKIYQKYADITKGKSRNSKDYEGEKLAIFNDVGYLEIAMYKSNDAKFGSATSLLGLSLDDTVIIEFEE